MGRAFARGTTRISSRRRTPHILNADDVGAYSRAPLSAAARLSASLLRREFSLSVSPKPLPANAALSWRNPRATLRHLCIYRRKSPLASPQNLFHSKRRAKKSQAAPQMTSITRIILVFPLIPSGSPAVRTTMSPLSTKPFFSAALIAASKSISALSSSGMNIGTTPKSKFI